VPGGRDVHSKGAQPRHKLLRCNTQTKLLDQTHRTLRCVSLFCCTGMSMFIIIIITKPNTSMLRAALAKAITIVKSKDCARC
jgi:hypothetical protein